MSDTDTFDPTKSGESLDLGRSDDVFARHTFAAATSAAAGRPNQDAWQADDGVWAVADGMGGLMHGADAAQFVAQRFVALASMRPSDELPQFVRSLSNELISRFGTSTGSTLIGGVLHGTSLDIVHVGDSRVFALRNGRFELVTRDHTVHELALELGTDPNSLTRRQVQGLTSYIGQEAELMTIGVRSFNVAAGDRLVFLTDGVHRSIPFAELQELVQTVPVDRLPSLLVDRARHYLSDDDATALVVEVTPL